MAEMPYIGVAAWTEKTNNRNPILRAIKGPTNEFMPLPYSKVEVETIHEIFPGRTQFCSAPTQQKLALRSSRRRAPK